MTSAQVGVAREISASPNGSVNGPVGLSLVNTAIPFPLFAKYRKNLIFPSISLQAAAGAQELFPQVAAPFFEAA